MRKHRQKTASSVPPDRHRQEVEKLIKKWLGGQLGIEKGLFRSKGFQEWAKKTVSESKETLTYLLRRYRIQPDHVMTILAVHKLKGYTYTHLLKPKFRQFALRKKDAVALERAAEVLRQWWSYLTFDTHFISLDDYPNADNLRSIARILRDLGPSKTHRPKETDLRVCAQRLAMEFGSHTSWRRPLYEHIGRLLRTAFPDQWNPAGDLKEAAKKLVKGWDWRIEEADRRHYPIWMVDKRLKVIHINQAAARLFEVNRVDLIGKDIRPLIETARHRVSKKGRLEIGKVTRQYLRFLKSPGFEWKTVLALECDVDIGSTKKVGRIEYDILAQRAFGAGMMGRNWMGTTTYLTTNNPVA